MKCQAIYPAVLTMAQFVDPSSYKLWSCFSDTDDLMLTQIDFTINDFSFGEKSNTFLIKADLQELQEISILDEKACWILNKRTLIKTASPAIDGNKKGHKRQLSA
jgi:hypothetical protein